MKMRHAKKIGEVPTYTRISHDLGTETSSRSAPRTLRRTMTDTDLVRFVEAQEPVYSHVTAELANGSKETHWMWFIFPQLVGLGRSAMAQRYAIHDLDQANRYLADPVLGPRLRQTMRLMLEQKTKSALQILGSPDDLKFRSCLTLFLQAASEKGDRALFTEALQQFYRGEPDNRTLELLAQRKKR
jgi:uncharacterized protein (DUF1810 family)